MKDTFYGTIDQTHINNKFGKHIESIRIKGYSVIENVYTPQELDLWRKKIDSVYDIQEREFGKKALIDIQELDLCRAPLLYDTEFIAMASHPHILSVIREILGDWFILNLQNAIINRPNKAHHQSSWHRDLPHQNFVISRPLAINALFAIDEFSEETGATQLLPFSHKSELFPSEEYIKNNSIIASIPAGSVIVFDPMLFHRAGFNHSTLTRRAVNHLYTTPIIKQQYDFSRAINTKVKLQPMISRLLGMDSQVPLDDKEWRHARTVKLQATKR